MSEPVKSLSLRLQAALADALLAAYVTFALFCLTLGFRTVDSAGGLTLKARPMLLAIAVGIVFVGRLLLNLFWWNGNWKVPRPAWRPVWPIPAVTRYGSENGAMLLVIAAALFPILAFALDKTLHLGLPLRYLLDLSILVLTYVMLGFGLNIVVGLAGLLDLGYVAFYAVGAYTFALLAAHFGFGFWMCLPLAGLLAALWGVILGFPVLRLRGDYLAIVTLAFGEIVRIVLLNWTHVTNGPNGISDIPKPTFFGLPFKATGGETFASFFGLRYDPLHSIIFLYYVILGLALLTSLFTLRLRRLPIGRAWEAMREDEIACRSLGINTTVAKLTAFATGAMFGGFAGSFFATRQGFISPESFSFIESAIILAIVVLGGMGSQIGVVLAAIVMIGGFELLRNMEWLQLIFGQDFDPSLYRMLLFGIAMVGIMLWRPRGIIASREPSIVLKERRAVGGRPRQRRSRMRRWLTDPLLKVEHLTMRFGGLTAVDDVSFDVGREDITALIGPNGAGKTTVFNCITGFYKPTEGTLKLDQPLGASYRLERLDDHDINAEARVARTFQNIRLFGGMTVLENLMVAQHRLLTQASRFPLAAILGLGSFNRAEKHAVEYAKHWLDRVGLTARADVAAAELPYGEQRKLEIARAMCTRPLLLCLDEPAAGLNARESESLNELLFSIRAKEGIALLLIEHDMSVVMRISDHIVVLDYGKVIADGTPEEIRNNPQVIAAYLGVPDEELNQVAKEVRL